MSPCRAARPRAALRGAPYAPLASALPTPTEGEQAAAASGEEEPAEPGRKWVALSLLGWGLVRGKQGSGHPVLGSWNAVK